MDGKINGIITPKLGGSSISGTGYKSGWGSSYSFSNDVTPVRINSVSNVNVENVSFTENYDEDTKGTGVNPSTNEDGSLSENLIKSMSDATNAEIGIARTKLGKKLEQFMNLQVGDPQTKDLHVEPVYSSWFGIQNEQMWELITGGAAKGLEALPNKLLKKQVDKKWNDDHENYRTYGNSLGRMGEFFDGVNQLNQTLQDDLAMNAEGYDKDYQMGKKQKFKNVNIQVAGAKWSGALLDTGEGTAHTAVGDFSGRARVGYLDAAASVSVGPGHVSAEASATFGLAKVEGKYSSPKLETESGVELLSFDANGSVSVCEGTVKAKAIVGGYTEKDENGKTVHHVEAGVSLNAEANLVKATASGQVNVFGIGFGGEATFKIGVGAKLDAGFVDGKLHFKIGLAAGIGVEFGFSIDLDGFIKNVCVLCDGAKETILGAVDDVCEWAEGAWDDVKEFGSDVWEGAKSIAGDVWDGVTDVAEDVGSWGVWPWNWF